MHFGNQDILMALFGLIPIALFFVWYFRRKRGLLERFAGQGVISHLVDFSIFRIQRRKVLILLVVIGLLIVVLARPQYGTIERPIIRKGVDIYIAIDTSTSMLAQDIKPNRFERARELMRSFIHRVRGDRVGIIVFAGTAVIQCPLTLDYDIAMNTLEAIDVGVVPVQGTDLGTTIRTALKSFKRTPKGYRVLVLITDGEDQGTDPVGAAEEAAKEGMLISCLGIGSPEGAPIPLPDGGFKEDKEGHKVMSKLDFHTLEQIAIKTGGKAILANPSGHAEVEALYADIQKMRKREIESKVHQIYEDRFQYVLLPAILLLIAITVYPERRRQKAKSIDQTK